MKNKKENPLKSKLLLAINSILTENNTKQTKKVTKAINKSIKRIVKNTREKPLKVAL